MSSRTLDIPDTVDGFIIGVLGVCASSGRHVDVTVDDVAAFLLEESLGLGVNDATKLAILDRVPIIVLEFHSSHILAFFLFQDGVCLPCLVSLVCSSP